MKQNLTVLLLALVITAGVLGGSTPAQAEEASTTTVTTTAATESTSIASLLEQIKKLTELLNTLKAQMGAAQGELSALKATLRADIKEGMTADEVKQIQEILATDPTIYPAGLTTGYFGKMTTEAIKKFQEKHGLEVTGEINDETRAALELIMEERKASGKIRFEVIAGEGKNELKERVQKYCISPNDATSTPVCAKLKMKYKWEDGKVEVEVEEEDEDEDDDVEPPKAGREGKALDAIADAKEEIADAKAALGDATTPKAAVEMIAHAEKKLAEANVQLDKKNYVAAEVLARSAERSAKRADSLIDDSEEDEDTDEDEEGDDEEEDEDEDDE